VKPTGAALKFAAGCGSACGTARRIAGFWPYRWLFEQAFPTPYERVYAPALDAGDLKEQIRRSDFPGGAIPGIGGRGDARQQKRQHPDEYKNQSATSRPATTEPQLRSFVEEGGTVLAIGNSTSFGYYLGLPLSNA